MDEKEFIVSADKRGSGSKQFITEKLLQFIWQFQYFNKGSLLTTKGESIQILNQGVHNKNQGPDFLNAQVRIDKTIFAGSVELHFKTSQWFEHGHSYDRNYNNVVLHVVYEDDSKEEYEKFPVLELQSRIPGRLLEKYGALLKNETFIPCSGSIQPIEDLVWLNWKERLVAERLSRKSETILLLLGENQFHWEEVFWWMLARNFGHKVNADAFESMARSLPLRILGKHSNQIHHLEALLFGQCNLLSGNFSEAYPKLLAREYFFLQKKYGLRPIHQPIHFLRMRPGNFPSLRLAQLAMVFHERKFLFPEILEEPRTKDLRELLSVTPNDYWHYHYMIDEPSDFKKKPLGKETINNILINTIVPFMFTYGNFHKNESMKTKALKFLEEMGAEENHITRLYRALNLENKSAADSQAFVELKSRYCDQQRCLECAIGYTLLKTKTFT